MAEVLDSLVLSVWLPEHTNTIISTVGEDKENISSSSRFEQMFDQMSDFLFMDQLINKLTVSVLEELSSVVTVNSQALHV